MSKPSDIIAKMYHEWAQEGMTNAQAILGLCRIIKCPVCKGTGKVRRTKCELCEGKGEVE